MGHGSFRVWPADGKGRALADPNVPPPDPFDDNAIEIYLGVDPAGPQPPPKDQTDLQSDVGKFRRALQLIYDPSDPKANASDKKKFRSYYVRLFTLSQVGLEGPNVATDLARGALTSLTAELIDYEAGRVKNGHMMKLGATGIWMASAFLLVYVGLRLLPSTSGMAQMLEHLSIQKNVMANFTLLWVGCFLGVWLSYGIRTSTFTLQDLTMTDSDRLFPAIRLIYAGLLTMVVGIILVLKIVEVRLGTTNITDLASDSGPMLAFVIGVFCGISELTLPTSVAKRASDFVGGLK